MSLKERTRRLSEWLRMRWKRMLSFRKTDWQLHDYPVVVRRQTVHPFVRQPRFEPSDYWARVLGWNLDATGQTREEALRALEERFQQARELRAAEGKPQPRPGTRVPIEFASTARIDRRGDIVNEILEEILEVRDAWVSDQSCLTDFTLGESTDELCARIHARYGVDVSDIPFGNLAEIAERIAKKQALGVRG
jgi:predicted RNase H-like HicB family nuclease